MNLLNTQTDVVATFRESVEIAIYYLMSIHVAESIIIDGCWYCFRLAAAENDYFFYAFQYDTIAYYILEEQGGFSSTALEK